MHRLKCSIIVQRMVAPAPLSAGAGHCFGPAGRSGSGANRDQHEQKSTGGKRNGEENAGERNIPVQYPARREDKNPQEGEERIISRRHGFEDGDEK